MAAFVDAAHGLDLGVMFLVNVAGVCLSAYALQDMAAFVDAAHGLGLGVMMDVVLHHGAPNGNMLWDFDGWEEGHNGGIYHEGAPDCMWGRCA